MKKLHTAIIALFFAFCIFLTTSCSTESTSVSKAVSLDSIPPFHDAPYVVINDNQPTFTEDEITKNSFEFYSELDELERCGFAIACIGQDIMPTEERGKIGQIKPSGWHSAKYDSIDGKYLYNRCHLIGFQLAGENANEKNLITGTRYMNVDGMLPFEDMVADYVKETDNHVMYRVTPIYNGNDLVANGVQMEGYSVEDAGDGICFHVFCYNAQPGIEIDYATGDSWETGKKPEESSGSNVTYILNIKNQKFHKPDCASVDEMKVSSKKEYFGDREALIDDGYIPCGRCNP